jgi:hypothetical protein
MLVPTLTIPTTVTVTPPDGLFLELGDLTQAATPLGRISNISDGAGNFRFAFRSIDGSWIIHRLRVRAQRLMV